MELEESEIINLAVNIFQNVGIKRYIGDIEALKHEDIYFEIYKIIFPDSMINIFKISESPLTTGQKIQKIIQEISSIIKLDLYHISGEAIAQGNINHITNWLQLLEALSNNFIGHTYHGAGGSAPDRDDYIDREFSDDCYHTVIGMGGEFDNGYDETTSRGTSGDEYVHERPQDYEYNAHNGASETEISSQISGVVLKPVDQPMKKQKTNKKGNKKKVTFNLEGNNQKMKKNILSDKNYKTNLASITRPSSYSQSIQNQRNIKYKKKTSEPRLAMYSRGRTSERNRVFLLERQKIYIGKMHQIVEQLEKKNIYDKNIEFQEWAYLANQASSHHQIQIEAENKQRVSLINNRIVEREQLLNTIGGEEHAISQLKQIFKNKRRTENRIRKVERTSQLMELEELLEPNFAQVLQNEILEAFAE